MMLNAYIPYSTTFPCKLNYLKGIVSVFDFVTDPCCVDIYNRVDNARHNHVKISTNYSAIEIIIEFNEYIEGAFTKILPHKKGHLSVIS